MVSTVCSLKLTLELQLCYIYKYGIKHVKEIKKQREHISNDIVCVGSNS